MKWSMRLFSIAGEEKTSSRSKIMYHNYKKNKVVHSLRSFSLNYFIIVIYDQYPIYLASDILNIGHCAILILVKGTSGRK